MYLYIYMEREMGRGGETAPAPPSMHDSSTCDRYATYCEPSACSLYTMIVRMPFCTVVTTLGSAGHWKSRSSSPWRRTHHRDNTCATQTNHSHNTVTTRQQWAVAIKASLALEPSGVSGMGGGDRSAADEGTGPHSAARGCTIRGDRGGMGISGPGQKAANPAHKHLEPFSVPGPADRAKAAAEPRSDSDRIEL